jgi:hypothetical protein
VSSFYDTLLVWHLQCKALSPLCRCQAKLRKACAKDGSPHHSSPTAAAAALELQLLQLHRAWEEYLNKLRLDNNGPGLHRLEYGSCSE